MKCVNIVVADADREQLSKRTRQLSHMEGIDVVASTMYGDEVIECVNTKNVDVVVTDLVLKGIDGFGVLDALLRMKSPRPKSCILTHIVNDGVMHEVNKRGASYFMSKPATSDQLYARIQMIAGGAYGAEEEETDVPDVSNALKAVGISSDMKGYAYLEEAVRLKVTNRGKYDRLTSCLFPKIADTFSTTSECIERSIRTAIQKAWTSGGFIRYALENENMNLPDKKPTAGEMIRLLVRMVDNESKKFN